MSGANASPIGRSRNKSMDHIKPLRLFDLVQAEVKKSNFRLDQPEQEHLQECKECQHVHEVFSRQFNPKPPSGGTNPAA
jgi:hypothetical protein